MLQDFLTVQEAKQKLRIPSKFHEYFPDTCCWCRSPMVINEANTIMKCGNPHCARKVGNQAAAILKDLGYKGYGPEKCTAYCAFNEITNITMFLQQPPPSLNPLDDLNNIAPTFPTLVKMLHIPNIGTKAQKIFKGYDSLVELIGKLGLEGLYSHVVNILGGKASADQFINSLTDYLEDIIGITEIVRVSKQAQRVVLIEITGHITRVKGDNNEPLTKDAFVMALNRLAQPLGIEFQRSSKFTQLEFMVADSPSNSRKYIVGTQRGILVTSDRLLSVVNTLLEQQEGQEEV